VVEIQSGIRLHFWANKCKGTFSKEKLIPGKNGLLEVDSLVWQE